MIKKSTMEGFLFITPWLVGSLLFFFGPILACFVLAFFQWDFFNPPEFAGGENFLRLIGDELVLKAAWNTFIYTVFSVPLVILVGLGMALLINQKLRGITMFRTIFFLPNVLSGVAVLLLWKWMLDPDFGLVNSVLEWIGVIPLMGLLGFDAPGWLSSPDWAMSGLVLMSLWGAGGSMMILLAGLQAVPVELEEAARIDGAGAVGNFFYVTLPLLTPQLFFLMVIGTIAAVQTFNQPLVMTEGGPANATLFYALYLFQNVFQSFDMGYGCALALVLFGVTLLLTMLQFWVSRFFVHY